LATNGKVSSKAKIRAGHFSSAEEAVSEGLRALKEQNEFMSLHLENLRTKIEAARESLNRGDFVDGEQAMEQMEREVSEEIRLGR
jgi:Arc/MetJ-type ribon-helix-helix transcriptional regulator